MHTQSSQPKRRRRPNLSFRVSHDIKAALDRRSKLLTAAGPTKVTPSDVARELLEHALASTDERTNSAPAESLLDEVMVSALFAKRALELVLSSHEGLAEKLLQAVRQEVRQAETTDSADKEKEVPMSNNTTGETLLEMQGANDTPTTQYAINKSDTLLERLPDPEFEGDIRLESVGFDRPDPTAPTAIPDPAQRDSWKSDLDAPTAITAISHERYEFLRLIGRGGMADVYHVRDRRLSTPWRDVFAAIKVFHGAANYGDQAPLRINNEVVALRDIKHPNVCRIFDILDTDDEHPAIVMEYIDGKSLGSVIRSGARIDYLTGATWGAEVASGLAAIHDKEIIHRDVKPDNIIIKARDAQACLLDLGVAKFRDDVNRTQQGVALGTPLYMAPEQLEGFIHPTSDLYALALVLALMFTGEVPLSGDRSMNDAYRLRVHEQRKYRLEEHAPGVPQGLADIVNRMLEFSPHARFQTGADVEQALRSFIEDGVAETLRIIQPIPTQELHLDPILPAPPRPRSDTLVPAPPRSRPMLPYVAVFVALAVALMIVMIGTLARADMDAPLSVPTPEAREAALAPKEL